MDVPALREHISRNKSEIDTYHEQHIIHDSKLEMQ